ncbi:MAG: hypothetical protein FJ215_10965 [Ignavibacteria bacterium]|nr:hypothetical protein [Ignavibacteria bacterium]
MQKHITAVAALQIGFSILGILLGLLILFGLGWVVALIDEPDVAILLTGIAIFTGGLVLLLSVLSIVGAFGLLAYRNWARIMILILSVFDLFNIPFGTALAIYTFWVLIQDETVKLFATGGRPPQT